MKKFYLIIGVVFCCILFSCKKESTTSTTDPIIDPVPTIPKWDSLPFPLTKGTWWKYQRYDSSLTTTVGLYSAKYDSSIELITVIGLTKIAALNNQDAVLLEIKNLTKGTLDSNYAYYYNARFTIKSANLFTKYVNLRLPQKNGLLMYYDTSVQYSSLYVNTDTSVVVKNTVYNNCVYTNEFEYWNWPNIFVFQSIDLMKPKLGFVYWYMQSEQKSHYVSSNTWAVRKLLDYNIMP